MDRSLLEETAKLFGGKDYHKTLKVTKSQINLKYLMENTQAKI